MGFAYCSIKQVCRKKSSGNVARGPGQMRCYGQKHVSAADAARAGSAARALTTPLRRSTALRCESLHADQSEPPRAPDDMKMFQYKF
eukprot:6172984-Pleurochrysis_carterae.AAC.4